MSTLTPLAVHWFEGFLFPVFLSCFCFFFFFFSVKLESSFNFLVVTMVSVRYDADFFFFFFFFLRQFFIFISIFLFFSLPFTSFFLNILLPSQSGTNYCQSIPLESRVHCLEGPDQKIFLAKTNERLISMVGS